MRVFLKIISLALAAAIAIWIAPILLKDNISDFAITMLLTFKVAFLTTLILLIISIPISYWLAYTKSRLKAALEAVISMPLILPPSVLGFYLLLAFSPKLSAIGAFFYEKLNIRLVFSFEGIVIASVIFSLPFMAHSLQSGFSSINRSLIDAAATLGVGRLKTLFFALLPNMKSSLLTGIVLTFAHTIGEFGVILMIGGSKLGVTKVASIAIYEEVESLNYRLANQYAFTLAIISFSLLLFVYFINRKFASAGL